MKTTLIKNTENLYLALILTEDDLNFFKEIVDKPFINVFGFLKITGNPIAYENNSFLFGYATDLIIFFTIDDESNLKGFDTIVYDDYRYHDSYFNLLKINSNDLREISNLFDHDVSFFKFDSYQEYIPYDQIKPYLIDYFTEERFQCKEILKKVVKKKNDLEKILPKEMKQLGEALKKKTMKELSEEYGENPSGYKKSQMIYDICIEIIWDKFEKDNHEDLQILKKRFNSSYLDHENWNELINRKKDSIVWKLV